MIPSAPFLTRGASLTEDQRLGNPQPGKPEATLPNLDTVRREKPTVREVPLPIPSTIPSKKNPPKPWDGRRVGDPLPNEGQASNENMPDSMRSIE